MKTIVTLLVTLIRNALISLALSGIVNLLRLPFAEVTWKQFFGGAAGIFVLLVAIALYDVVRTAILMKKDPVFRAAAKSNVMGWREYKKMKKEHPEMFHDFT